MVEQWFPKPKVKGSNPFSPDPQNPYLNLVRTVAFYCLLTFPFLLPSKG